MYMLSDYHRARGACSRFFFLEGFCKIFQILNHPASNVLIEYSLSFIFWVESSISQANLTTFFSGKGEVASIDYLVSTTFSGMHVRPCVQEATPLMTEVRF